MRADRAKYAIDNFGQFAQATAEENKATAQGTITYFGTYSVNEPDRTIAIHVEGSSFPNWNGTDQKRLFEITEDELKLTVCPPRGAVLTSSGSGRNRLHGRWALSCVARPRQDGLSVSGY